MFLRQRLPEDFYVPYFELTKKENIENDEFFNLKLHELEVLKESDSEKEKAFFTDMFRETFTLFSTPFYEETFDFSNEDFWERLSNLSEKYSKDTKLRKMDGNRGSEHFLYITRTFFGLYNLLHDLDAKINVNTHRQLF